MFFQKRLAKDVDIAPKLLGRTIQSTIDDMVRMQFEGKMLEGVGYVIMILEIAKENISEGRIDPLTGIVRFTVTFSAIVFKPVKNEVLDVIVSHVVSSGFFADAGPLQVFVAEDYLPETYEFIQEADTWRNSASGEEIKKATAVRIRILSSEIKGASTLGAVGEMVAEGLGPLRE